MLLSKSNSYFLIIVCSILLCSCVSDRPKPLDVATPNPRAGMVYAVCEGSLGNGNAELTVYDSQSDSTFLSCFKSNNGLALGDIFQSIFVDSNELWLSVNNSDRITILNKSNYQQIGSISLSKPRYLVDAKDGTVLVGSLYSNTLYRISRQSKQIIQQVELPYKNIEGIIVEKEKAYVCCWDINSKYLYEIAIPTLTLIDSFELGGFAPQAVVSDKNGKLWVSGGNILKEVPTYLNCIDVNKKTVVKNFDFGIQTDVLKPCMNLTKDSIYVILDNQKDAHAQNGVYKFSIDASTFPTKPFWLASRFQYYWALGVSPISGNVYVGDPKGFIQKSQVSIINPDGILLNTFLTDLGISSFYFEK
jgi:DNA-binding beta-propeller fold protein YncE